MSDYTYTSDTNLPENTDPLACSIKPVEAFMSTDLNHKINTYEDLSTRILNLLGYPAVGISDLHRDQLFEAISIASELYTKYAGFDLEYMIVDSRIYKPGVGIRIDQLYTIASMEPIHMHGTTDKHLQKGPDQTLYKDNDVYVNLVNIPSKDYLVTEKDFELLIDKVKDEDKEIICLLKDISRRYPDGIEKFNVVPSWFQEYLIKQKGYIKENFKMSKEKIVTLAGNKPDAYTYDDEVGKKRDTINYQNTFDYDLMDYRRVVSIREYTEGSSTTMSSLFSLDAALAQQSFFSYSFSLRGFDLTTYTALRMWTKDYARVLATQRDALFDPRTQFLRFSPEPRTNQWFFGLIEAWVEKPLRHVVKSPWVLYYSLALVKIMLGRVRSKYGDNVQLLGGGTIAGNVILQEGLAEKEKLETELKERQGFGEAFRPKFYIG